MKWYSTFKHPDNWFFIIEDGGNVGFYLYVYEGREGFRLDIEDADCCSRHQQDHLQDTLVYAKEQALEDFGVPLDSWVKTKT
jgi:hypothetical protein